MVNQGGAASADKTVEFIILPGDRSAHCGGSAGSGRLPLVASGGCLTGVENDMPQFFKKLEITIALPYYEKDGRIFYAEFDHISYDTGSCPGPG